VDHLQRDAAGNDCCLSAGFKDTGGLDHLIMGLGRDGALAGKGRMGGVLSIEIIVLAPLATVMFIWGRYRQNLDTSILHVSHGPGAIGARGLNADAPELSQGPHPGEHLPVPLSSCCERLACEHMIVLIDNGSDMKIFVRVDAANDRARCDLLNFHIGSPRQRPGLAVYRDQDAWTGQ
jgi:hypothetical protein